MQLQIFDVGVVVESDDPALEEALAWIYAPFQVGPEAPFQVQLAFRLRQRATRVWETAERSWPLRDERTAACYCNALLLGAVVRRVTSHWLLHGGALRHGRGATLLVGPSGCGKTTLTLALAQQGAGLLSDEIAALDRGRKQVTAFPRSLGLRTGTRSLWPTLEGKPGLSLIDFDHTEIRFLPWAEAGAKVARTAGPVRQVFLLDEDHSRAMGETYLQVTVDHAPEPFRTALSELGSGLADDLDVRSDCVVLTLPGEHAHRLLELEGICLAHGVTLLNVQVEPRTRRFTDAPEVHPLSGAEGLFALGQAVLNPRIEPPGRIWMELADILSEAEFYRLRVGEPERTVALVQEVMGR